MKSRKPTHEPPPELDADARILGAERSPELELAFLFGIAAFAYFAGLATDAYLLRLVAKPWPAIALARWISLARPRLGLVSAALYAGALGDVLLELGDATFMAGVVAFLVGHILYVGAMLGETRTPHLVRAAPPVLVFAVVVGLLSREMGARVIPFAVYGVALSTLVWRAAARIGAPGIDRRLAILGTAGAASFMLSDALIGFDRFLGGVPGARWLIITTYWLAQAGLTASFALGQDEPPVLAMAAPAASPSSARAPSPVAARGALADEDEHHDDPERDDHEEEDR